MTRRRRNSLFRKPDFWAILALVALSVVTVAFVHARRGGEAANAQATPVATAEPTTSATQAATGSLDPSDQYAEVKRQSIKVVEAYYLLYPTETTTERTKRIAGVIDLKKMTTADVSVGENSCWDQNRLLYILTERAVINPKDVKVEQLDGPGAPMLSVSVPGSVTQFNRDGSTFKATGKCLSTRSFTAKFTWVQQNGKWMLTHFGNPERVP